MRLGEQALHVAYSQLGTTEKPLGSNAGPEVERYLARIGLGKGYSWCMAFMYWCFSEAAIKLQVPNVLIKTGGVLDHWRRAKPQYKILKGPQIGDIFIMDFGRGKGHTGLVTGSNRTHIFTIEGNSDANGSRTGGMVCENKRSKSDPKIIGYLRYL